MSTLAIIHTTPTTVTPLKAIAADIIPDCDVINFVDDSILPQLARNGGNLAEVEDRLIHYACFAEQAGADIVLEACSSVGEVVGKMQQAVTIPVVRIDEAMAEDAVHRGKRLGVAATLRTTLHPTTRLLQAKSDQVEITAKLIDSAYRKLLEGDQDGHDAVLLDELVGLARSVDVVVLAQASMARVIAKMSTDEQGKFLSSPRSGMERVRNTLLAMEN